MSHVTESFFHILHEFNDKTYPKSTNVSCWWCCYPFETSPIGVPCKQENNIFYVIGCFCSFNCAYSFIKQPDYFVSKLFIKLPNSIDLLNMYVQITGDTDISLKNFFMPAPSRFVLDKFGGKLTIDEYRKCFKNNTTYNIIATPMLPWGLIAEEIRCRGKTIDSNGKVLEIRMAKKEVKKETLKKEKEEKKKKDTIKKEAADTKNNSSVVVEPKKILKKKDDKKTVKDLISFVSKIDSSVE